MKILACKTALFISKSHILEEKCLLRRKSEQGINRDVSGNFRDLSGNLYSLVFCDGAKLLAWPEASKNQGLLNPGPPRICRRESQLLPLLDPAQGNMGAQFLKTQIARLTSFEDRLDDVRCEECTIEYPSEVPPRQAGVESQ